MKRKLKHRFSEALGFHLIRSKRGRGPYPAAVVQVARAAEVLGFNGVLDVGGHFGGTGTALRQWGFQGWILSFEPDPRNFKRIRQAAQADSRWKVFPYALGEEDKTENLMVARDGTLTSFLPTSSYGQSRFGANIELESKIPVTVRRLDGALAEILEGTDATKLFLKMDTQGFDLSVFAGASGCLDQIVGLQSELAVTPIYDQMPNYLEVLRIYGEAGFVPGGFFPVNWIENGQTLLEVDVVMFKSS